MSNFFENNKRTGVLGLLLPRRSRLQTALLLLVVAMMLVFVLPPNLVSLLGSGLAKLPGGAAVARRLSGPVGDFSGLVAAFRAAKEQRRGAGVFFDVDAAKRGRGPAGTASSIDLIKGGKEELAAGAELASKIKGGVSVAGVLTPDDATRREDGLTLAEDRLKELFAGSAGRALSEDGGLLRAQTAAPKSAGAVFVRSALRGKLAREPRFPRIRIDGGCTGPTCAFRQLTAAAARGGASFDGKKAGLDLSGALASRDPALAPRVDGVSRPDASMPADLQTRRLVDEADRLESDMRACKRADASHREELHAARADFARVSRQGAEPELRRECRKMNAVGYKLCTECPIRARRGCSLNAYDC